MKAAVLLALAVTIGAAQAAPLAVLHILKNGHVRIDSGPEMDMDQFKAELRRRVATKSLSEMRLGLEENPTYAQAAAALVETQKAGVKIGFIVGQARKIQTETLPRRLIKKSSYWLKTPF